MRINQFLPCCMLLLSLQKLSAQVPVINSFSPKTGAIGTVITITGKNLKDSASIKIGAAPALMLSNNGVKLTAMVMPGSINGIVNITTRSGTDSSESFAVTASKPPSRQLQHKLTGTGGKGSNADIGIATAISADNNTIALGGAADSTGKGAVWIYSRAPNGEWLQYEKKLVATDAVGRAQTGQHVAISADGNTLIAGGILDNESTGAAWIFVKDSSGAWVQQGSKLVGTNAAGPAMQGCSVAISADGNTVVTGGYADSAGSTTIGAGAVWVFTRDSANVWSQQGNKLAGNDANGNSGQGTSVAISADGNTIMSGGTSDGPDDGSVWVFEKDSFNVWKQYGPKLKHKGDNSYPSSFGFSVALNADGTTAVIGTADSYNVFGGAWIFVRNINGVWEQQGDKLVAIDTASLGGRVEQGRSVAISADGNTMISGGYGNNRGEGGAWIFTRKNNIWSPYKYKLLGNDVTGSTAQQGYSVSISADGNFGIVGGPSDGYGAGAGWIFADSSIVLPVTIGKFQAYLSGKGIQTKWKTYSEINMDHYIVERSADGHYFKEAGSVKVKSNSVENNYEWFDASPLNGDNFYRLKAVDKDRMFKYSPVIKITIGVAVSGIKVFPNPSIDKSFYVQLNNLTAGNYTLSIYNNAGQKVYTSNYAHSNGSEAVRVSVKNIPEGIYHIDVTGDNYKYQTKMIVR